MTKPIIQIGEETREMNDEEFAQYQADQEIAQAAIKAKAKAERDKVALLERLGLTEDEAKLLLL